MSGTPAEQFAQHLRDDGAQAAIVVDGSADDVVAELVAAGWTLEERVDLVAGKRIRFMRMPDGTGLSVEPSGEPAGPVCPVCGAPQREKWSGVECSADCGWWSCA